MRNLGIEDRKTIAIPNFKDDNVNKEYQADLQQCKYSNLKDLEELEIIRLKSTLLHLFHELTRFRIPYEIKKDNLYRIHIRE